MVGSSYSKLQNLLIYTVINNIDNLAPTMAEIHRISNKYVLAVHCWRPKQVIAISPAGAAQFFSRPRLQERRSQYLLAAQVGIECIVANAKGGFSVVSAQVRKGG